MEIKELLKSKWKDQAVYNGSELKEPSLCVFKNIIYAMHMLNKHIRSNGKICFHTDVDVDGICTTYIFKKAISSLGSNRHLLMINKDKVHGIQQKHVDYFAVKPVDLLIVTDSSSNEIELIKSMNCDVLCIDHHELLHRDTLGICKDGLHRYCIINSTIDNDNSDADIEQLRHMGITSELSRYTGTPDMSCGLVVYEFLRVYCEVIRRNNLLKNLALYQYAGITLFSDAINLLNARNQWYIENTVYNDSLEPTLKVVMQQLNKYNTRLTKSYIEYTFAPLLNKAIRSGNGSEALDKLVNHPELVYGLKEYDKEQQEALEKALTVTTADGLKGKRTFTEEYICFDITGLGVRETYTGVIASRLGSENNKSVACYVVLEDGTCKGSFRGTDQNFDYRTYFDDFSDDIYAQGHPLAFGFKLRKEQLYTIMQNISTLENRGSSIPDVTIGKLCGGLVHIDDLLEFKRSGDLMLIGFGNSKVQTKDEILLRVSASDVSLKSQRGKLYMYNVLGGYENGGFECKAFKPLEGTEFNMLVLYEGGINGLTFYIR